MPQVPYQPYTDKVSQDHPAPLLHFQIDPNMFGENIGRAVSALGSTIGKVGDELWNRAVALQELKNETEVTNALSSMETQSAKLRADYFETQGANADNGYQGFIDAQNKIRDDIRAGLSNPMAQKMFDRTALGVTNRAQIAAATHAAQGRRLANQQADLAGIDAAQTAATYSMDDNEFNAYLNKIDTMVRNRATDQGILDEPTVKDQVFKAQSAAWRNRIAYIGRNDPTQGAQLLAQAIKDRKLHSNDLDVLEGKINTDLNTTGSRVQARRSLEQSNDIEGYLRPFFPNANLNGISRDFGLRIFDAFSTYQNETGRDIGVANSLRSSGFRSNEEQAEIYARSQREGFLAAPPGRSRHESGQALDIARGPLLDWLHQNAGRFGLEFLPGWRPGETSTAFSRDPVHIQLARGAGDAPPPRYNVPESTYMNNAERMARQAVPNAPQTFIDMTRSRTQQDFRQQRSEYLNQQLYNRQQILEGIVEQRPNSIDELYTNNPNLRPMIDGMDPAERLRIEKQIRTQSNVPTQDQINNNRRLTSMSIDPASIPQFLDTDIDSENLTNAQKNVLMKTQDKLKSKVYEADPRYFRAMSIVRNLVPLAIQKDEQQYHIFKGALLESIELWQKLPQNQGKYPTPDELKQMTNDIVNPPATQPQQKSLMEIRRERESTLPGGSAGGTPFSGMGFDLFRWAMQPSGQRSLLERSQDIPDAESDEIKYDLLKRGLTATPENIQRLWIAKQLDLLRSKPGGGTGKSDMPIPGSP